MEAIARRHALEAILPALRGAALPAVAFSLETGASRSGFGGAPLLPRGYAWPTYLPPRTQLSVRILKYLGIAGANSKKASGPQPLDFLLQIDLTELRGFDCARALPDSGLLTFFYDVHGTPWGYDPAHLDGFRVVLVEDRDLVETAPPRGERFARRTIRFWSAVTLPHFGSRAYDALEQEADLPDQYFEFTSDVERQGYPESSGLHRILGHSANVQGDMQLQAQLVSNGLYCGDDTGYDDPRRPALEADADDWLLLLQLDTDDSVSMKWGDMGMLYFWIRKTDLAARRFERCWMTLQCG